jgi:hypothetical protein
MAIWSASNCDILNGDFKAAGVMANATVQSMITDSDSHHEFTEIN